jgi:class 3 adenylate cyclase
MLPAPPVFVPVDVSAAGASTSAALAAAHPVMAAGLAGRAEEAAADDHDGQSRAGAARGHVQELEMYARAALLMRILQRQEGERTRILARVLRRSRDVALRFCTYAFKKAELERRWVAAYISPSTLGRVRAVLAVLALFHVFRLAESLFERQVLSGQVGSGMHPSPREWGGRLVALSLLGSFLVLSYTSWYAEAGGGGHDGDSASAAATSVSGEASHLSATTSPTGLEPGSGASAGHGVSGVHDGAGVTAFPPRQRGRGGKPLSPSSARSRPGQYQRVRPQDGGIVDAADAAAAADAASAARLPMSLSEGDGDADGDEALSPIAGAAGRTTASPELAPRTWLRTPSGSGHLSGSLSPRSFGGLPGTAGGLPSSPVAATPPTSLPGIVMRQCRRLYGRWQVVARPLRIRLAVRRYGHEVVLLFAGCLLALSGSDASAICLDFIFFLALVSNGGAVPFLRALFINSAAVLCCIVYGFASRDFQPEATGIPGSAFAAWDLFFLAASFLMVLVASAATEYYLRHRFGVAQLTADEVARNNALVYRMLPVSIAKELMRSEGRQYISQSFSGVTLLFSDIQGFTAMSAAVAPEQVISMLNRLFAAFDALTELHGTFKLMTIGDAYVSVAGVPYAEAPSSDQRWVRPAEDPEGSPLDATASAAASKVWRRAESPSGGRGRAPSAARTKSQTGGELAEEDGGLHNWLPRLRASFGDLQDKLAAGASPHSRPARAGSCGPVSAAPSPTARSVAGRSGGDRALSQLNRRGHSAVVDDKSPVHSPGATPTGELSPRATPGSPVALGGATDAVAAFRRSGGRSLAAVGIKHPVEWLDEENERHARRAARRLGSSGTRSLGRGTSSRALPVTLMSQHSGATPAAARVPASPATAGPLLSAGGGSVIDAEHAASPPKGGANRPGNSHLDTDATTQATDASSLNGATGLMPTLASLETEVGGRQGQDNAGNASFLRIQRAGDDDQPFWHDGNAATTVTEAVTSAGASFAELKVTGGAVSDAPVDVTSAPRHTAARPQLTLPGTPAAFALSQEQHASDPSAGGLALLQTPLPRSRLGSLHRRRAFPGGGSASAASTGRIGASRSFVIPGTQDHRAFDVSLASLVSPADYAAEGFEDAPNLAGMQRSGLASRLSPGSEGGNPLKYPPRIRGDFPHPAQLDTEGGFDGSGVRGCLGPEMSEPVALPGEVAGSSVADVESTTHLRSRVGSGLARATMLRFCSPGDARGQQPTAAHVSAARVAKHEEDLRSGGPLVTESVAARGLQADMLLARNVWKPDAALALPVAASAAFGDASGTVTEYLLPDQPVLAGEATNYPSPQQLLDDRRATEQLSPIPDPTPRIGGSEDASRRFCPMSLAATPSHQEHTDRPSGSLLLQAVSVLRRDNSGDKRQSEGAVPSSRLASQANVASLRALRSSQSVSSAAPTSASHSSGTAGTTESATMAAVKTGSEPAVQSARTGASMPAVAIRSVEPVDIICDGDEASSKLLKEGAGDSSTPLLAARPHVASSLQPLPDHTYVRPEPFPALDWPVLHPEAAELVDPIAIHAARMLRMAVDMTDCVRRIRSPLTGEPIKMRLGLHTGNIHGGVIGTKTLRYDVFGPDVLAANNMESNGVAGGIVVSESTMRALVSLRGTQWAIPGLTFLPHGTIAVKGLGPVEAYVVQVEGVPLADGTDGAPQHG